MEVGSRRPVHDKYNCVILTSEYLGFAEQRKNVIQSLTTISFSSFIKPTI